MDFSVSKSMKDLRGVKRRGRELLMRRRREGLEREGLASMMSEATKTAIFSAMNSWIRCFLEAIMGEG